MWVAQMRRLFADGGRIYFMEGSADAPILAQVSASGGETGRVAVPFPLPELMDFSAVSSEFLVGETVDEAGPMPLWAVPVPAGTAHRLGEIVAWDASWSPDGHEIAYSRGREIYLAESDGSNPNSWRRCRGWAGSRDGPRRHAPALHRLRRANVSHLALGSVARGNRSASAPARVERRRTGRCRAS